MSAPIILIPPSEGKAGGGRGRSWRPGSMGFPMLDDARAQLIAALAATLRRGGDAGAEKLLGVKGDTLRNAVATDLAIPTAPTRRAIDRYTGVLYDALDHTTLDPVGRRRLNRQVLIVSGLWGLVRPDDPIPDYKLKIGSSLDGIGRLAQFWRPLIDEALAPVVSGRTVWNLLPNEHAAAWSAPGPARREIRVRFLDDVGQGAGRRTVVVSHWNKLLKGSLVRHLLAHQPDRPDGLDAFEHPEGYRYRPDLTETAGTRTTVSFVSRRA